MDSGATSLELEDRGVSSGCLVALVAVADESGQQHSFYRFSIRPSSYQTPVQTFFNLRQAPQSGLAISHAFRRFLHVKQPERVRVTFLLFLVTLLDEAAPVPSGLCRVASKLEVDMSNSRLVYRSSIGWQQTPDGFAYCSTAKRHKGHEIRGVVRFGASEFARFNGGRLRLRLI